MNFIDYENFKNKNNKEQPLLSVPKGLILMITEEKNVSNPDTLNKMLIKNLNLTENNDDPSESNCKMLNETVYKKFYDIMVPNKRTQTITRKKKKSKEKKSKGKKSKKNK